MRSVILSLLLFMSAGPVCAADIAEGKPAPPLDGIYLNGARFNLQDMHGKVVIVSFWASWCPTCRQEMPVLEELNRKYHAQGLEIIGISIDNADDMTGIEAAMQGYTYPTAQVDAVNADGFGRIWRLPLTFVIDRNGILRKNAWQSDPKIYRGEMDMLINSLLAAR